MRLFCLPHAGAGVVAYRDWPDLLAPHVEVVAARLPGRDLRRRTPSATTMAALVADLAPQPLATPTRPLALFGHSMGAWVAYELAHTLSAAGHPPVHLFVSGQRAPHRRVVGAPAADALTDAAILDQIAALSGTPPRVLAHPGALAYLLPILRADLGLCERYRHVPRPPLAVPVTALGGADDEILRGDALSGWRDLTTAGCAVHSFPGGHFYLREQLAAVTEVIRAALPVPVG